MGQDPPLFVYGALMFVTEFYSRSAIYDVELVDAIFTHRFLAPWQL
jgi:hypothetical protein